MRYSPCATSARVPATVLGSGTGRFLPVTGAGRVKSERVPGGRWRELQVADIGAESEAYARTNRHHDNIVRRQRGHAEPPDEIGRAIDAPEALIDRVGARQIVNEHHGAGAFAASVEANRRALPEHAQIASVAGIERALAIAQPRNERAARFLAENVAVGLSPVADRLLDDLCKPARHFPEESMAGIDEVARRVARRLLLCSQLPGADAE